MPAGKSDCLHVVLSKLWLCGFRASPACAVYICSWLPTSLLCHFLYICIKLIHQIFVDKEVFFFHSDSPISLLLYDGEIV